MDVVSAGLTVGALHGASKVLDSSSKILDSALVQKVLGPSADYLGDQLKLFTQKNLENIKNILKKAEEKIDSNTENSQVSPLIVKDLIFEASFAEDEITQEYYSGLLASARNEDSFDDRGKTISTLIRSLSHYQLLTHHVIYLIVSNPHTARQKFETLDYEPLLKAFKVLNSSQEKNSAVLHHVFSGLEKHNLVKPIQEMNEQIGSKYASQYYFQPTITGIELFLWANGLGKKNVDYIYSEEFEPFILLTDDEYNALIYQTYG